MSAPPKHYDPEAVPLFNKAEQTAYDDHYRRETDVEEPPREDREFLAQVDCLEVLSRDVDVLQPINQVVNQIGRVWGKPVVVL